MLVFCKEKLYHSYEIVFNLVEKNNKIRKDIPPLFLSLMRSHLLRMENAFMAGFSTITWTSMKIPEFCKDVNRVLKSVEIFLKEVKDMKEARIDEVLENLSYTSLVYLPDEPIDPKEFVEKNIEHRRKTGKYLCFYYFYLFLTLITQQMNWN